MNKISTNLSKNVYINNGFDSNANHPHKNYLSFKVTVI